MAIGVDGSINVVWEDDFTPVGHFFQAIDGWRLTFSPAINSPATNLSNNTGNSFGAQVAVDLDGNIELCGRTLRHATRYFVQRSSDGGATFAPHEEPIEQPGHSGNALVGVDAKRQYLRCVADNVRRPLQRHILAHSSDGGANFSTTNVSE